MRCTRGVVSFRTSPYGLRSIDGRAAMRRGERRRMPSNPRLPKAKISSLDSIRVAFAPILKERGANKAVVFGSHARGEADQYSDLDLVIVTESPRPFLERHRDFSALFDIWPRGLDLLIYTPGEIAQMLAQDNSFLQRALEEGVVIYEK